MKRIRVVFTGQMRGSTSGTDMTKAINLTREAEMNRLNVIQGALSVENQLDAVIAHYFFRSSHERRAAESLVLNSDWCSFAAKCKLIAQIISEQNLLKGRGKSEFDKLLRDVMSVRNAFAHGKFCSDEKRLSLSFFEGTPRDKELTDEYLAEIETLLRVAFEKTFTLTQEIRAAKPAGNINETI